MFRFTSTLNLLLKTADRIVVPRSCQKLERTTNSRQPGQYRLLLAVLGLQAGLLGGQFQLPKHRYIQPSVDYPQSYNPQSELRNALGMHKGEAMKPTPTVLESMSRPSTYTYPSLVANDLEHWVRRCREPSQRKVWRSVYSPVRQQHGNLSRPSNYSTASTPQYRLLLSMLALMARKDSISNGLNLCSSSSDNWFRMFRQL